MTNETDNPLFLIGDAADCQAAPTAASNQDGEDAQCGSVDGTVRQEHTTSNQTDVGSVAASEAGEIGRPADGVVESKDPSREEQMTELVDVTDGIRDDESKSSKTGMSYEQVTFEPCFLFVVVLRNMTRRVNKK